MESLISSIAQADPEAKARLRDFLEKRGPKVKQRLEPGVDPEPPASPPPDPGAPCGPEISFP